jgi:hypothetical protein
MIIDCHDFFRFSEIVSGIWITRVMICALQSGVFKGGKGCEYFSSL